VSAGNFILKRFHLDRRGNTAKAKSEPQNFAWLLPLVGVVGIVIGLTAGYVKWGWPMNWYAGRAAAARP
jgi:hypothetical protein